MNTRARLWEKQPLLENLRLCFYGGVDFFFLLTSTYNEKHSISKVNTLSQAVINDPLLQLTAAAKGFCDPPPVSNMEASSEPAWSLFLKYISRIHLAIMKSLRERCYVSEFMRLGGKGAK